MRWCGSSLLAVHTQIGTDSNNGSSARHSNAEAKGTRAGTGIIMHPPISYLTAITMHLILVLVRRRTCDPVPAAMAALLSVYLRRTPASSC
jgi:hypothetical protein